MAIRSASLFIVFSLLMGVCAHAQQTGVPKLELPNLSGLAAETPATGLAGGPPSPLPKNSKVLVERAREFEDAAKKDLGTVLHQMGIQMSFGGDVSGGGSSFRNPKEPAFLVDFLMVDLKFQETRGSAPAGKSFFPRPFTAEQVVAGIELDPRKDLAAEMALLDERLALWEANSPRVVTLIREIIARTKWRATLLDFKTFFIRDDHYLPKEVPRVPQFQHVAPVSAVFKGYGVFILDAAWNKRLLGLTSRAGLLAHEALRSMRVEVSSRLQSRTIQLLTAHLMLSEPGRHKAGLLDELYLRDLWSEEDFVTKPAAESSRYIDALCERAMTIESAAAPFVASLSAVEGWTEQAVAKRFAQLDREARASAEARPYLGELPDLAGVETLSAMPTRALTYWTDQGVDFFRFWQQKSFAGDIAPGTPTFHLRNAAWMFQKFTALELFARLKTLSKKACDQKSENARKDYMMVARTMMRLLALKHSVRTSEHLLHNFHTRRWGLTPEDYDFVEEVYQEGVGAQSCTMVPIENPYLFHGEKVEYKMKCEPLPVRHFPQGLPEIPRIGPSSPQ